MSRRTQDAMVRDALREYVREHGVAAAIGWLADLVSEDADPDPGTRQRPHLLDFTEAA